MSQFGRAFVDTQERLMELCKSLNRTDFDRRVPACPDWTVRDLVAHLVGVAADVAAGNIRYAGSPQWTAAQIATRRDGSADELLEEWRALAPALAEGIDHVHPAMAGAFVGDIVTHEQDLRAAVGRPGGRESLGAAIALDSYARFFGRRIKDNELAGLELRAGQDSWQLGTDEPAGRVVSGRFEMLRGLTGRRTRKEIRGFEWTTDPEPYLPVFSTYRYPETSLNES
jgi:uncharacterized protein (TIGR03083 family)